MTDIPTFEQLKEKLIRALKAKAVLAERSKRLQQQADGLRSHEDVMNHLASELLERQRELHVMLHRASSVLHQLQNTNLALSAEFTQLVKELPAPKDADWDQTMARVNDLFKKTHELAGEMQDEIFRSPAEPGPDEAEGDGAAKTPTADVSGNAPQPQAETAELEPPPQRQDESESETIPQANLQTPDETPVETAAQETKTAEAHEPAPRDRERTKSVEQLFNRVQSVSLDATARLDDEAPHAARRQGLLARLFRRCSKGGGSA